MFPLPAGLAVPRPILSIAAVLGLPRNFVFSNIPAVVFQESWGNHISCICSLWFCISNNRTAHTGNSFLIMRTKQTGRKKAASLGSQLASRVQGDSGFFSILVCRMAHSLLPWCRLWFPVLWRKSWGHFGQTAVGNVTSYTIIFNILLSVKSFQFFLKQFGSFLFNGFYQKFL